MRDLGEDEEKRILDEKRKLYDVEFKKLSDLK